MPSPRNSPRNRPPLRIRGGGTTKSRTRVVCFKVIAFMISAQLVAMFLLAVTVGNPLTEGWRDLSADVPATTSAAQKRRSMRKQQQQQRHPEPPKLTKEQLEQQRRLAPFEVGDARQHRVLYTTGDLRPNEDGSLPLDNYGTRTHFDKRADWNAQAPYLVVGGSDGSGTRAVVNTLQELGAFFHIEDRRTMDVHGTEMFHKGGWPPLVNLIMNITHSANYELDQLPKAVRDQAVTEMTKLKKSIDKRAESKLKRERRGTEQFATAIHVGWKAPVAMVLLPIIRQVFGPTKFLHVVRDGRDVSLSDNQSPVKKFYNIYYGLDPKAPLPNTTTTQAMQLWNDMNQQVMEWGKSHSDGQRLDYLTIRTEDLVNPDTKLDALLQLADFVGSKKSVAELCCMSQHEVKDMGKSTKSFGDLSKAKRRPPRRLPGGPEDFMDLGVSKGEFMRDILEGPPWMQHGPGGLRRPDELDDDISKDVERLKKRREYMEHLRRERDELHEKDKQQRANPDQQAYVDRLRQERDELRRKDELRRMDHNAPNYKQQLAKGIEKGIERMIQQRKAAHHKSGKAALDSAGGGGASGRGAGGLDNQDVAGDDEAPTSRRRLLEENKAKKEAPPVMTPEERAERAKKLREKAMNKWGPGHRPSEFLGRRDKFVKEAPEQVKARYGKWVKALEDKPELSAKLHELGKTGLEAFGYEPATRFLDPPDGSFSQQCQDMLEKDVCMQPAPSADPPKNIHLPWRKNQA